MDNIIDEEMTRIDREIANCEKELVLLNKLLEFNNDYKLKLKQENPDKTTLTILRENVYNRCFSRYPRSMGMPKQSALKRWNETKIETNEKLKIIDELGGFTGMEYFKINENALNYIFI